MCMSLGRCDGYEMFYAVCTKKMDKNDLHGDLALCLSFSFPRGKGPSSEYLLQTQALTCLLQLFKLSTTYTLRCFPIIIQ